MIVARPVRAIIGRGKPLTFAQPVAIYGRPVPGNVLHRVVLEARENTNALSTKHESAIRATYELHERAAHVVFEVAAIEVA